MSATQQTVSSYHFTAASCALAQALYYSRAQAFGLLPADWHALVPDEKRQWVEKAQGILDAMRPQPPSPLFQFAANVVRAQFGGRS